MTLPRRWSVRVAQPCGAVLAHGGRRHQVEGPGAEAVRRRGQRPDRADLDGVPGEVRLEGVALSGADLLERAALDQFDHRVARHLVGEPGAARAEHAPLAVQQHLGGDGDGLLEGALLPVEAGVGAAVRHRLVLQGALAALVADRAVQRVVDEQELHHPLLGLLRDGRGDLRLHDHAVGARDGAGRHRLALALDLDDALPASAGRVEERVVAEARDLDAQQLGGADDQGALGHADLDAVDRERDEVLGRNGRLAAPGGRTRGDCHAFTPGERSCRLCRRPRGSTWPGRRGSPCR